MSDDDDTDWSSDSSEDDEGNSSGLAPPPPPAVVAISPTVSSPAQMTTPLPASLVDPPSQALPAQQVFLACPVQITLPSSKTQAAGATILYTAADNSWKFLFYDERQQPVVLEPIGVEHEKLGKGKKQTYAAPSKFALEEGPFASIVRHFSILFVMPVGLHDLNCLYAASCILLIVAKIVYHVYDAPNEENMQKK